MSAFGLAVTGFMLGLAYTTAAGIIEGLFGRTGPLVVLLVLLALSTASVYVSGGVEQTASGLYPWPYWVGLLLGGLPGLHVGTEVQDRLERDGTPLLVALVR